MKTIISHSIPFHEVINDLAREMGTDYSQDCEEYILEIPPNFGTGIIKGINFQEGIGLLFYDCTFHEDVEIKFIVNQVHPLKFLFCEKGGFSHHFEDHNKLHKVMVLENIIVASSKFDGHILKFDAGVRTKINSLEINRQHFEPTMDCEIRTLDTDLKTLFLDTKATEQFYYHGDYSVQMADLFLEMDTSQSNDFVRTLFLHGSAYKILSLQILEYQDSKKGEGQKLLLKKRDQELVRQAADLIDNDILNFKTVKKLGENVGLNNTKLQNGFKMFYGLTVNEYVQQRRLDLAKNLIRNTDFSFSEIAYMVGLSSKSYFSKIFKDRYGITPSEIRNRKTN